MRALSFVVTLLSVWVHQGAYANDVVYACEKFGKINPSSIQLGEPPICKGGHSLVSWNQAPSFDSLSLSCTTSPRALEQRNLITMGGSTYPGDTWSLEVTSPVLRDVTYTVTRADVAGCNACNAAQNWITLINTDPVMEGLVFARYLGGSGKSLGITIEGRQPGTSIEFTVRATDNSPYQVGQGTTPIFAELEELQSAVESQCPEGTVETGQCRDQVLNDCQSICCSISTGD